ncbi:hypothetical protein [Gemmatimonas sp.]|uniref:hypothetical protein n=1 Tax=Gemmatimonas sp. TaxID=1962908 RepID=UPI003F71F73B
MRHRLATTLLRAVGASRLFVDDVLGDLEEITTQRREAAESCGPIWYAREVLRLVPYAIKDGTQGSAIAAFVDVAQKAVAAWLLLGMLAATTMLIAVQTHDVWNNGSSNGGRIWFPSDAFVAVFVLAGALRCVVLGYVSAWIDAKRPLITLLIVAAVEAFLHYRLFDEYLPAGLLMAAVSWSLVMTGGLRRVFTSAASSSETRQVPT